MKIDLQFHKNISYFLSNLYFNLLFSSKTFLSNTSCFTRMPHIWCRMQKLKSWVFLHSTQQISTLTLKDNGGSSLHIENLDLSPKLNHSSTKLVKFKQWLQLDKYNDFVNISVELSFEATFSTRIFFELIMSIMKCKRI